jgi:hypothetical protein
METEVAGERVVLLAERALFRPATGELLVADAHWGKAATFRAAGIAVPGGTTADGLARLDSALERTGADEIVFWATSSTRAPGRPPQCWRRCAAGGRGTPGCG